MPPLLVITKVITIAGELFALFSLALVPLTFIARRRLRRSTSLPLSLLITLAALMALNALLALPDFYFQIIQPHWLIQLQIVLGYAYTLLCAIIFVVMARRRLLLRYAILAVLLALHVLSVGALVGVLYLSAHGHIASNAAYFIYFYTYWSSFTLQAVLWLIFIVCATVFLFKGTTPESGLPSNAGGSSSPPPAEPSPEPS